MMKKKTGCIAGLLLPMLLAPGLASAHAVDGVSAGFFAGLAHPLGGWDHIAGMIAVGLWAARLGDGQPGRLAALFIASMSAGALLAFNAVPLPAVEAGIMTSLLILGLLVAFDRSAPPRVAGSLVATFGMFHGYAHGAGFAAAAVWGLVPGLALSSAVLIIAGAVAARTLQRSGRRWAVRGSGAGIGAAGAGLLLLSV